MSITNIDDAWMSGNTKKSKTKKSKFRCWESHPVYVIDGCKITGGSCTSSYGEGYDIFIALDAGGCKGKRSYPWNDGHDIYFKIPDMNVPPDVEEFMKLITWTAEQMRSGKSVFVGCIGGHGRTGLFLAALTNHMTGAKDAISIVRKKYCKKAVESTKQIAWLHEHFDINKVAASKTSYTSKGSGTLVDYGWGSKVNPQQDLLIDGKVTESKPDVYMPVEGESIFAVKKD